MTADRRRKKRRRKKRRAGEAAAFVGLAFIDDPIVNSTPADWPMGDNLDADDPLLELGRKD